MSKPTPIGTDTENRKVLFGLRLEPADAWTRDRAAAFGFAVVLGELFSGIQILLGLWVVMFGFSLYSRNGEVPDAEEEDGHGEP